MEKHIYHFDGPLIGYCRQCKVFASYSNNRGLHCQKCLNGDSEISVFVWDKISPYPDPNETPENIEIDKELMG